MAENNTKSNEEEGLQKVKSFFLRYYALWEEFGIDEEAKEQREKIVWKYIENLLHDILDEEVCNLKDLKERIEKYSKKYEKLCKLLSLTPKEDENSSLVKKEEYLLLEIENLIQLKHKRQKSYKDLRGIEAVYCSSLGVSKLQLPNFTGVPSENQLLEIEEHVKHLKEEHDVRLKRFSLKKKDLTTILEVTEVTPETPLEQEILSGNEVSLTDETFETLEGVISKAQEKKDEMEAQKKFLLRKLSALWNRLGVPEMKKIEFLSKHVDYKSATLNSISEEIKICEKVKSESIKQNIMALKQELERLWQDCYASESQKRNFIMYDCDEVNDDVLIAFESEVQKWKNYYKEVEHILTNIKKRNELWEMLQVFETKSSDPNRLKNRGGILLKEEKERKVLLKDLPALEDHVFTEIDIYESAHKKPFTYYGEDFRTWITCQWQERKCRKDNEKLERKKRRSLEVINEPTPQTPTRKPILRTPNSAPCTSTKITPKPSVYFTPNSKSRMDENSIVVSKFELSPNISDSVAKKCVSQEDIYFSIKNSPKTDQDKYLSPIPQKQNCDKVMSDLSNCTTYSMFANELDSSAKFEFQSSIISFEKSTTPKCSPNKTKRIKLKKTSRSVENLKKSLSPVRGKLGLPFLF